MPNQDVRTFLAEASTILLSSLDYEATLARVADLVVPKFADWCTVSIIDPNTGNRSNLFAKHVDPKKVRLAELWRTKTPYDPNAIGGESAVLRTGKSEIFPLVTPDMITSAPLLGEDIKDLILKLQLHSYVCVPLKVRERVLGTLSIIWADSNNTYSEQDLAMFENLASIAAIAIDNAQLYTAAQEQISSRTIAQDELSKQIEQQHIIAQLGQQALSGISIEELMHDSVKLIAATLETEYVHILEKLPEEDEFLLRASTGWPKFLTGNLKVSTDPSMPIGQAFSSNRPVVITNLTKQKRFKNQDFLSQQGITSSVTITIGGKQDIWGTLGAHTKNKRVFSKNDIQFLQSVANVLALSLDRVEAEERMRFHAFHDTVTGIPNRALLQDRLELEIARAKRNNSQVGILFLDLDRFKHINDSLGHAVGDLVLREAADRLKICTRPGDTIARFGGDEFVMVLPDILNTDELEVIAKRTLASFEPSFVINSRELSINVSIGIALYPHDGESVEDIIMNADTALYRVKELGRNGYRLYTQTMNLRSSERLTLESELRKALEQHQFELWYQPVVDIARNKIISGEALPRWRHPTLGIIYPGDFWELAEDTGLSIPLFEWSLETAANQIAAWNSEDFPPVTIAINLSARQLEHPNLIEKCRSIISKTGISANRIEIEVTETMAMQNIDRTVETLKELRNLGFSTSVDDFGIGHSSLNYLKRLPVSKLKIDRSFISDCIDNPQDAAIVRAIISLAQTLNFKVTAEGVENNDQLSFLLSLGCNSAQGYLFNPALPAVAFTELLQ